jgi:hypothetical protein
MIVSNPLGMVASRIATLTIPYNTNLAAALNTNNWKWNTGSGGREPVWFAQNIETRDGEVAAQSGYCTNNQQSTLTTTITGPGTLTFWWKVSSEEGFDFLRFYLDSSDQPRASISGETDWEQLTFDITAGTHTLRWVYSKDFSLGIGRDAGWLDEVIFTPPPPVIARQPVSKTVPMESSVQFLTSASGAFPMTYQWLKNGTNLAGATGQYLSLTNVTRRDSAVYAVRVSNAGGSVTSSNATLKVLVPQRLGSIRLAGDGACEVFSGDADGGLLLAQDLAAFEAQASTNLIHWEVLADALSVTNGSLLLRDPGRTNHPMRFYRVVEH